MKIRIKIINSYELHDIRSKVLRNGLDPKMCRFEGDTRINSIHIGAFNNNKILGGVSLIKNICNENSEVDCFQLRGLCVYNEFQNYGIGTKIIHKIENIISEVNINYVWMNARESAVKFYLNLGYTNSNKSKIIGNIGLHYMLYKYL
ncbi:MAG: GNAT family N-acetyltransferase [Cryomorphaceae bacterium]|nr:MAG: GNAT family N-acetyltransferase [Cryomorphaceae bacterium]